MSDQLQPDGDLAIAHVLFIDIVAYSKLAIVLAATMDHEFLRRLPIALDLLIVSVFGLLAWLLLGRIGRWLICLLSFLALSVAYLLLAFLLYNFLGIFVPIVPPLMTLLGCGFLGFVAQQLHKRSHSMVHA